MIEQPNVNLTVFDNELPIGIALLDSHLQIVRHNRTWANYLDLDAEIEQSLSAVFGEAYPILFPLCQRAVQGTAVDVTGVRLNIRNTVMYWNITLTPLRNESEEVAGVLFIGSDVTEQVLSQQLLERRVQDRTRKLAALYDVLAVSAESNDLDTVLYASLQKGMNAIQATGGAIQLLDETDETLVLRTHIGLDPEEVKLIATMSAEEGLGWTANSEEVLILKEDDEDDDWDMLKVTRTIDANVYAGVPMYAKDKVVGVLNAFRESKRPFSKEDIALLISIADQIGLTIENMRLRADNEQLLLSQERNRLARELHDAVTQSLYSLMLMTEALKRQSQLGRWQTISQITEQIQATAQQALKEMRLLIHNLRPSALEEMGLLRALQQRLESVEGRAGIHSQLVVEGEIDLPPDVEGAFYYITQEALNNALKHANASTVHVIVRQNQREMGVTISDDGAGFDVNEMMKHNAGLGLTSMLERATQIGGMMTIESSAQGTTITTKKIIE